MFWHSFIPLHFHSSHYTRCYLAPKFTLLDLSIVPGPPSTTSPLGTRIINQWSGMQFAKTAINGREGRRASAIARESTVIILFRLQEILFLLCLEESWLTELHNSSNERCNDKSNDCISFPLIE